MDNSEDIKLTDDVAILQSAVRAFAELLEQFGTESEHDGPGWWYQAGMDPPEYEKFVDALNRARLDRSEDTAR